MKFQKLSKNRYRIFVNCGVPLASGNLIDAIAGITSSDQFIDIERKAGVYYLLDNSLVQKGDWKYKKTELGFSSWDEEVENLDTKSEDYEVFSVSHKLKWKEVVLDNKIFRAKDIERLVEALSHVSFGAFCAGDI